VMCDAVRIGARRIAVRYSQRRGDYAHSS
jgi:hypothetical protein